jgi:hypothetical protein
MKSACKTNFGIVLGLVGTAFLILYKSIGNATMQDGNFLFVLVNAISCLPDYRQEING